MDSYLVFSHLNGSCKLTDILIIPFSVKMPTISGFESSSLGPPIRGKLCNPKITPIRVRTFFVMLLLRFIQF